MIALIFDSNAAAASARPRFNGLLQTHSSDPFGDGEQLYVCTWKKNQKFLHIAMEKSVTNEIISGVIFSTLHYLFPLILSVTQHNIVGVSTSNVVTLLVRSMLWPQAFKKKLSFFFFPHQFWMANASKC